MIPLINSVLSTLVELATLLSILLMLHWMRRTVSIVPTYMLLCMFFIFGICLSIPTIGQLFGGTVGFGSLDYGLILIPSMVMYFVLYESHGPIEAQKVILTILMGGVGLFFMAELLVGQYSPVKFQEMPSLVVSLLKRNLVLQPYIYMMASHLILLFLLPVFYQFLRKLRVPIGVDIFVLICLFTACNQGFCMVFANARVHHPSWKIVVGWLMIVAVLCTIAHIYLYVKENDYFEKRKTFGMFSTMLVHFQSVSNMRQSVDEWAERYQVVFDNAPNMIILLDERGTIVNANNSACTMLPAKYLLPDFDLTKVIADEKGNPLNWHETLDKLTGKSGLAKKHISFTQMLIKLSDDSVRNIDFNVSLVKVNEQDMGLMIINDTTERRREEMEKRKLQERMEHAQRLESVGVLAGGVAHDFNNLLHSMQASMELLEAHPTPSDQADLIGNIHNAISRASDMVMKLLGFARKGKYEETLLNITDVAKNAADLFTVGLKDVTFRYVAEPAPLMVRGDETQLQQVLLNLLLNAKDALKPGEKAERRISMVLARAEDDMRAWKERPSNAVGAAHAYAVIKVKDNGIGMTEEVKNRMFEPFFSTKGMNGTGLGLSMAYGCITHHHGWLEVFTAPDDGCEIFVFLPLHSGDNDKMKTRLKR